MKILIKNILIALLIGYFAEKFQVCLESNYISNFLDKNLVALQVTLVAINLATLSIVLTKIRELIDSSKFVKAFKKTIKEMLFSIKEQFFLIFISMVTLLVKNSKWLATPNYKILTQIADVFLISCFVYAMIILYDTAKSIFIILDYNNSKD